MVRRVRRHWEVEMAKSDPGQHSATRRALHEALLHQIWLDHLIDDVAFVAKRCSDGLNADRAAGVVFGDAA